MKQVSDIENYSLWVDFEVDGTEVEGLFYANRYDPDRLQAHADNLIDTLADRGAQIAEVDDEGMVGVSLSGTPPEQYPSTKLLLEELSVVNVAKRVHASAAETGQPVPTVAEHIGKVASWATAWLHEDTPPMDKIEAYNRATLFAPEELAGFEHHRVAMTPGEKAALSTAKNTVAFAARALDGRHLVIGVNSDAIL